MSDFPSSKLLFYSQQGPDNQMDLISEEEQVVTRSERNNWIINIENTLDATTVPVLPTRYYFCSDGGMEHGTEL